MAILMLVFYFCFYFYFFYFVESFTSVFNFKSFCLKWKGTFKIEVYRDNLRRYDKFNLDDRELMWWKKNITKKIDFLTFLTPFKSVEWFWLFAYFFSWVNRQLSIGWLGLVLKPVFEGPICWWSKLFIWSDLSWKDDMLKISAIRWS